MIKAFSATVGVALVLIVASCHFGSVPSAYGPAVSPQGTQATVIYERGPRSTTAEGELVEVREDGLLLLLSAGGLTLVDHRVISEITFLTPGGRQRLPGVRTEEERQHLAQFSRYPFGLADEQLTRLLAARNQERLVEVRP